jgi:hypothetical protein
MNSSAHNATYFTESTILVKKIFWEFLKIIQIEVGGITQLSACFGKSTQSNPYSCSAMAYWGACAKEY